jgi:tetratricopeptide (TPR) repeat protein
MVQRLNSASFLQDETTRPGALLNAWQPVETLRPLRQIYFELGTALLAHEHYPDAITAFEHAASEPGATPDTTGILLRMAYACEHAGLEERAFRTYLELVQNVPENAAYLLNRAHTVLTPGAALSQGKWVVTEWARAVANIELNPEARSRAILVPGRVHLFLAEYTRALERSEEAVRVFPSIGTWASRFFSAKSLPPALAEPKDAHAHFVLAQLHRIFGQYAEAGSEVDVALELGFSG